jgi:hypothetical protein
MNFSMAYYCDQCCGSGINIPDPNFPNPDPGSRICIKEFKYFIPKNWFPYFLPFPDPGVKKAPDPGSGTTTLIVQK